MDSGGKFSTESTVSHENRMLTLGERLERDDAAL